MNIIKTKKLVQGAMIAALFGVAAILNTYTGGLFDIFICYGMVSVLAWYGYQYTLKDSFIVFFASIFIVTMITTPFFIVSAISSCLSGIFIGEALKSRKGKGFILVGVFLINLLNNIMIYEVFSGVIGMNLIEEMSTIYQEIAAFIPITLAQFLSLAPLLLVVTSLSETYVIVILTQLILKRFKIEIPGSYHFALMHLPKKAGVLLVLGVLVSFGLQRFFKIDHYLVMYIYIICYFALVLQGLSFISFVLIMKRMPQYVFIVFLGMFVFHVFYVMVGIYDIFSDLRKNMLYNESDVNKEEIV